MDVFLALLAAIAFAAAASPAEGTLSPEGGSTDSVT